jgi:predicted anti-sigma-YlaC factor YlaD
MRLNQTEITCREVVEVVNDYLGDVMPIHERAAFEQHLHACPWCLTYLQQVRDTVTMTGALRDDTIPPALEAGLLAMFRARRKP